jgi:CheY-like chemotaxis protein
MILLIDDEPRGISSYKEDLQLELEPKYEVKYLKRVDDALRFFEEKAGQIDLIILDIMMPPGESFRDDKTTESGLRTGVSFYERVRKTAPKLPVIILTNVSDPRVLDRFNREANCWFLQKKDVLPFQLTETVVGILSPSGPSERGK